MRNAIIVFFLVFTTVCFGQGPQLNNSITTTGIGRLAQTGLDGTYYSGSLLSTNHGQFDYNINNPASLGHLTKYTLFDGGVTGGLHQLEVNGFESDYQTGNLGYFSLAFPLFNSRNEYLKPDSSRVRVGVGTYLKQQSTVGYDISSVSIENGEDVQTDFIGSGNNSIVGLDFGGKYRNLSFGLGAEYQFGKIRDDLVKFIIDDQLSSFSNTIEQELSNRVFKVKAGGIIDIPFKDFIKIKKIKKDTSITDVLKLKQINAVKPFVVSLGFRANIPFSSRSEVSQLVSRRNFFAEDILPIDTLSFDELRRDLNYPIEVGFGALLKKKDNWKIGFDLGYTNWSQLQNLSRSSEFNDSWKVSFGGEYLPLAFDINNYLNRIRYRSTLYVNQDYLNVNNESILNYGIGFGLGLPIKLARFTSPALINIGADFGQYESENDFYTDSYVRFNFGFTLTSDSWFLKQKIN